MSKNEDSSSEGEHPITASWRDANLSFNFITDNEADFELSFRSISADIGRGRIRRDSLLMENEEGIEIPQNETNTSQNQAGLPQNITTPTTTNLTGSMQLDQKQFGILKDFLFDTPTPESPAYVSNLFTLGSFDAESEVETTFDLTDDRLRRLFDSFDGNNNGTINYQELKLGFAYHGAELGMSNSIDDRTFSVLVGYLDADNSGEITFEEFSEGLRLLMLRNILQQVDRSGISNSDSVTTQVFDYNIGMLDQYFLYGKGQVQRTRTSFNVRSKLLVDFFLEARGDDISVRWVNITGKKASNIMKMMALKYRLHPLALEDALESTDHRPKADSYDGHYFIMVPVFYLRDDRSKTLKSEQQHSIPRLKWWQMLFRAEGKNESDTSATENENSDNSDDDKLIGVHTTSIFITRPSGRTVITFNNEPNEERCWHTLQDELKKDYSKVRQYDGQYFAYRLLDKAVDKIGEIVKKLKKVIREEKKRIVRENYENLDRIHSLKKEMYSMSRKFKPFLRLLVHVIEDDSFSPAATIYLRDVLDNLEIHEDDVKELIAMCDAVDLEDEKRQAKQMDSTLYTLTVFTVTILPAQFLTGVWGMNFTNMPELGWQYGYLIFWLLAILLSVITVSILNLSRRSMNY